MKTGFVLGFALAMVACQGDPSEPGAGPDAGAGPIKGDGPGVIDTRPDVAAFERTELLLSQSPNGLLAADFNGDGLQDLAVRDVGNGVTLLLQRASAGLFPAFEPSQAWPSSEPRQPLPTPAFRSFDVDRDGRIDLVTGDQVLRNAPGGLQAIALPTVAGCATATTSLGDFDRDGLLDVLVTCLGSDPPQLLSGLTLGDGQLGATTRILEGGWGASRLLKLADVNRDGVEDFLIATGNSIRAYQLTGVRLDTFAEFPVCVAVAGSRFPSDVAVFDADAKDGLDFAAACDPAELVLGTPGAANILLPYPATVLVSADLAGEGKRELVVADGPQLRFGAVQGGAYERRGDIRVPQDYLLTTGVTVLAAADLNGDRRDEVVVAKTLHRAAGNAGSAAEHRLTVLWPR